jgi:bifunctional DNA-binding transcriptional regulator/antitoxin component of YhaV-PrlF toxin-antitoxin module
LIPEDVRKALGLEPGARFVVMGEGDVLLLKKIEAPDRQEFRTLARKVRGRARRVDMKRSEVNKAVRATRRRE